MVRFFRQLARPLKCVRVADLPDPDLDPEVKAAFDMAYDNIHAFHAAQASLADVDVQTMPGVRCRRVELASGGHPFVDKPHAWGPAKRAIVEWLRTASSGASAAGEVAGARAGAAGAGHRSPAIAAVQDTGT